MKKVILCIVSSCLLTLLTTLHLELLTKQIHIIPCLRPLVIGRGIWLLVTIIYGDSLFGHSTHELRIPIIAYLNVKLATDHFVRGWKCPPGRGYKVEDLQLVLLPYTLYHIQYYEEHVKGD